MTYTRHTVRPGQSLFSPRPCLRPFRVDEVAVVFVPGETAWWGWDEWAGDQDYRDWNKGPGVTSALWKNNYNAAFIGWRPVPNQPDWFEVCIYANDHKGGWETSKPLKLKARDAAIMTVNLLDRRELECRLSAGSEVVRIMAPWRKPWYNLYRWSGLSIGGADNAPGPYGGKAHKHMDIYSRYHKNPQDATK